jgi:hypothetical protein
MTFADGLTRRQSEEVVQICVKMAEWNALPYDC